MALRSVISVYIICSRPDLQQEVSRDKCMRIKSYMCKIETSCICLLYLCLIWKITHWKNNLNCLKQEDHKRKETYIRNDRYRTRYLLITRVELKKWRLFACARQLCVLSLLLLPNHINRKFTVHLQIKT